MRNSGSCGVELKSRTALSSNRCVIVVESNQWIRGWVDYQLLVSLLVSVYLLRIGRNWVKKRYIHLFTCLHMCAVHLEVVHSLEADSFILALHRFQARRGNRVSICSDNGSSFVGAEFRRITGRAWGDRSRASCWWTKCTRCRVAFHPACSAVVPRGMECTGQVHQACNESDAWEFFHSWWSLPYSNFQGLSSGPPEVRDECLVSNRCLCECQRLTEWIHREGHVTTMSIRGGSRKFRKWGPGP